MATNAKVTAPMVLRALTKDAKHVVCDCQLNYVGDVAPLAAPCDCEVNLAMMADSAMRAGDGGECDVKRSVTGDLTARVVVDAWVVEVGQRGRDVVVNVYQGQRLFLRFAGEAGQWQDGDPERSDDYGLRGWQGERLRSNPLSPLWLLVRPEVAGQLGTEDFLPRAGAHCIYEALWNMTKAYLWGSHQAVWRLQEMGDTHPDVMVRWVLRVCRAIMDTPGIRWRSEVRDVIENQWAHLSERQELHPGRSVRERDGRGAWRVSQALESLIERAEAAKEDLGLSTQAKILRDAIEYATRAIEDVGGPNDGKVHALWLTMELSPPKEWEARALYSALGTIAQDYDPDKDNARMSDRNAACVEIYRLVREVCGGSSPSASLAGGETND